MNAFIHSFIKMTTDEGNILLLLINDYFHHMILHQRNMLVMCEHSVPADAACLVHGAKKLRFSISVSFSATLIGGALL